MGHHLPQKHHTPFLAKPAVKIWKLYKSNPTSSFLGNSPLYTGFSWIPLNIVFFQEPQKY